MSGIDVAPFSRVAEVARLPWRHSVELIGHVATMLAMDLNALGWVQPEMITAFQGIVESEFAMAALIFVGTVALVVLCVPAILIPAAMTSGAMLGTWTGAAAVMLGALVGSQLLFFIARRLAADRVRNRLGDRLGHFQERFAAHGLWYVAGLRLIGAPHFVITAGSALMPMRSTSFAIATLIGLLPAISMAAAAGSSI